MNAQVPGATDAVSPLGTSIWTAGEHEQLLAQACQAINADEASAALRASMERPAMPGGINRVGARRDAGFKAIGTAPSINKTPIGPSMVPLPYPTVQDLSNSVGTASSVRFNGEPAYVLNRSTQPKGTGDEPGTGKGVRSGTVTGEVRPVVGSSTVRVEGKYVVRDGDACTMNGGNNPGIYLTSPAPGCAVSKGTFTGDTDPPVRAETPAEEHWFSTWWKNTKNEMGAALDHPWEAVKGGVKGLANIPSALGEMLLKGAALQSAGEMEQASAMHSLFGQMQAAEQMRDSAAQVRDGVDAIHLPMFEMSNAAQAGGDKILTAASLVAGGAGLVKSGVKGLAGLSKGTVAVEVEAAKIMTTGAKAAQTDQAIAKVATVADNVATPSVAVPAGDGLKILKKIKSLRRKYLGKTPGKKSATGRKVQERMRADGDLITDRLTGKTMFRARDGKWYDIKYADMAHKEDAVTWWNHTGRRYGARAPEVRVWMLESKNYVLEHRSINRSLGAKLEERYLPPLK